MPEPKEGASPAAEVSAQATPTTPVMEIGGRKVVWESDLLALKKSHEKVVADTQQVHNSAIDQMKLGVSAAEQAKASLGAKIQDLEKALTGATSSTEDVVKLKKELETATSRLTTADTTVLDTRKKYISAIYGVSVERVAGKTALELDAFESALQAVLQSKGGGAPYAIPRGGGAPTMSNLERAAKVLEGATVGVRTAEANKV